MKNINTKKRSAVLITCIGVLALILNACSTGLHSNEQYYLKSTISATTNQPDLDQDIYGSEYHNQNSDCDTIVMRDSSVITCIIISTTRKELRAVDCPNTGVRHVLLRKKIFSINGELEIKKKDRKSRKNQPEEDDNK